mgnify:CR=1 FL=1
MSDQTVVDQEKPTLSNTFLNIYSFSGIFASIVSTITGQNYAMFLTNVALIPAAAVGTLLLITRLLGIFMTPLAGAIIEKTNLKWGKYRSWILIFGPIGAAIGIFRVINPNIPIAAKSAYYIAISLIGSVTMAFSGAAHAAMFPIIGANRIDRIRLATRRSMGASSGQILSSLIVTPIMVYFGLNRGNDYMGYLAPVLIFSSFAIIAAFVNAHILKPFDSGKQHATRSSASIFTLLSIVFTNKHLFILFIAECFRWTSRMVMTGLLMYNFRYVFNNLLMIAPMMTASNLVSFTCTYLGQHFALKFGRKRTYAAGVTLQMITYLIAYFLFRNNITMYAVMIALGHIGYGPSASQTTALFADVADHAELTSGKSVKGLVMTLQGIPTQLANAVAGAMTGFGLAAIGFDATQEVLAESVINGIAMISTLLPAVFLLLAIITIQFFTLDDKMIQELKASKAATV